MNDRAFTVTSLCPECERGHLRVRRRRVDREPFIGCSKYPACNFIESYDERIQELLKELNAARAWASLNFKAARSKQSPADLDYQVKELIFAFHPDRNPNGLDGNKVVAALNRLRSDAKKAS